MIQRILAGAALAACLLGLAMDIPAAAAARQEPVRIGMVTTLFNDISPALIELLGGPFKTLMKEFTGLDGQLQVGGDAFEVGKKLTSKQLDLAVFHGFEYG